MTTVNNLYEFMEERGFGEKTIENIKRNTYKYTDCGAWFAYTTVEERIDHNIDLDLHPYLNPNAEVTIGSIIEGSDAECIPITLLFPFALKEFWDALQEVEDEAKQIWHEVNEEEV